MFSALKKLTSKNETENATRPGLQTMSRVLQSKFSKGVQYNMKIIIKGDRNVGKSCLFNRLQGRGFLETYIPTEEIQVTSIQWNYKATDDVVKVEVWDVVDKGKKRMLSENLKLGNGESQEVLQPALDAEFLNVYKGTHGVILVMDITKNWTFEYVQRELEKVPGSIPVLVLGNHCDMSHHRTTTPDHVLFYLETLQRKAPTRYAESSMSNGFGLKFLHKWFNLPFLQLQRETLFTQLETNQKEIDITTQELDLYQQTDDSNYKVFLEKLTSYRRHIAEANAVSTSSTIVIQTQHIFPSVTKEESNKVPMLDKETMHSVNSSNTNLNSTAVNDVCVDQVTSGSDKRSTAEIPEPVSLNAAIQNIEEFIPDDHLDKSFLEDTNTSVNTSKISPGNDSDSETDVSGNPLVSGFQDDLDPEDSFSRKQNDSDSKNFTSVCMLEGWMNAESRGSPDGGDDQSGNADTTINSKVDPKKKSEEKIKKKKSSKKKSKSLADDDLENFLNSEYEAL